MNVNSVKWVQLGDHIELCSEINNKGQYGVDDAMGMTITKEIIPTKADLYNSDISKFLVVKPCEFVYNPRTHGKKIGLGYNNTGKAFIISWNNTAFRVKDISILDPDYLYILFCREEWDRNACFRSWGSSTEVFSWSEFTLMEIPLPSIEVQKKLVATYNGLKSLAEHNEALVGPLSNACEALITNCKKTYRCIPIGDSIEIKDQKNKDDIDYEIYGINKEKTFMPTHADTNELDKSKYKIVCKEDFVFSGMQTGRDVCIRLALYDDTKPIIVSPAYTTFRVINPHVLPKYLFLHFKRQEMDRYGWFLSDGSVRSNLDWDRFCEIQIPLPPVEIQESIVNLYNCLEEAKKIASEARERLKSLCPALIQRAINS